MYLADLALYVNILITSDKFTSRRTLVVDPVVVARGAQHQRDVSVAQRHADAAHRRAQLGRVHVTVGVAVERREERAQFGGRTAPAAGARLQQADELAEVDQAVSCMRGEISR